MKRGTVIVVANQKGGIGKTTLTHCIGDGLMKRGLSVLYIDMDGQGNLTSDFNIETTRYKNSYHCMKDEDAFDNIMQTERGDIIPSSPRLADSDNSRLPLWNLSDSLLNNVIYMYDIILIDTPPSISAPTLQALTAADMLIVPMQAEIYSLDGLLQMNETIKSVRDYNKGLKITGIVINKYKKRAKLHRQIVENLNTLAEHLNTKIYNSYIRESVSVAESQVMKVSLFDYAPRSTVAQDVDALIDEILFDMKERTYTR